MDSESREPLRVVGRYALYAEIAFGGMATVHIGRLLGPAGFTRTVAIKRLHPQFAKDPEFVAMALDEARLAARIQHPHVVSVLDVVASGGELFLVMDYIHGESLGHVLKEAAKRDQLRVPPNIAVSIVAGALHGLHAAHEARSEDGTLLNIVHRDVSPQNILLGVDGMSRVVDFGIAKAANRIYSTRDGQLKGKISYMAPEQVNNEPLDRRTDVYAASVVLWETLVGRRLFSGEEPAGVMMRILDERIEAPSRFDSTIPSALDDLVLRGLAKDPSVRFATARDMALALEQAVAPATTSLVGSWVEDLVADRLRRRAEQVAEVENASQPSVPARPSGVWAASQEPTSNRVKGLGLEVTAVDVARDLRGGQFSQVSSISVATPAKRSDARRKRVDPVRLGSIALSLIAIVAAATALLRRKSDATTGAQGAAALVPTPVAAPSGQLDSEAARPTHSGSIASVGEPTASTSASAAATAARPPISGTRTKAPPTSSIASVAPAPPAPPPSATAPRKRPNEFGF
jgi:eukaryotic-like serine/threonine-protein kinase